MVAETQSGVILETQVRPANAHDSEGACESIRAAGERAGQTVERALTDTAYGGVETRREIESEGSELIAKAPPIPRRRGCYTLDDFKLDRKKGVLTCPARKKSIRRTRTKKPKGWTYAFSRNDCSPCPLRSRCTTAKIGARFVTITEVTEEQQKHRRRQKTKAFKRAYRRRQVVEHRIARLVQLGLRQARYLGRAKTAFQVAMTAAVANLVTAQAAFCLFIMAWTSTQTPLRRIRAA